MLYMEECGACSLPAAAQTAGIVSLIEAAAFVTASFLLQDCPLGAVDHDLGPMRAQALFITQIVSIVVAALALIATVLLFIGVHLRSPGLLVPWLVLNGLSVPLVVLAAVLFAVLAGLGEAFLLMTAILLVGICVSFLPAFLVYIVMSTRYEFQTVRLIR
ncbi:uncharacterized protein LOC124552435 isoform X2 [Schistocerca americana]|uniref:uncharacterized protein LOC124552435 isoform X2 n=1 Tax=Schistocerca americana TaxID=7009 RepID=UPI001F4FE9C2|nr:uncharacterized protein LOC124552435 isoform X2 [Schistocerca americana]